MKNPGKTLLPSMILAARSAGRVLMHYYGGNLRIREKQDASLVTQADTEAELAAVTRLRRARKDFGFLTEENDPVKSQSGGRWIIDPLDGTTNFIHGFPMFCVSIAAEWEGRIVAGVIFHPVMNDLYTAVYKNGAKLNGKPLRVSRTRKLTDSLLTTGFTYRKDQWLHAEMEAFERLSSVARAVRRPGSAALDLAYTARGVFDGFWERRLSPWDVAAGVLLVQEAGGKVTDFQGRPFRLGASQLLASNSRLHPELLKSVAPEFCPI